MEKVRVRRSVRRSAPLVALALVAGALAVPSAQAQSAPGQCPTISTSDEISKGMTGTGWTVAEGSEPSSFSVEVLGVLEDGIGPGRDMIVIEANSAAIEEAGGIWYGMSGSPIYINGRFAGALAYGLGFGGSNVAGLTAAADIVALAQRPAAAPQEMPRTVRLTPRLADAAARSAGTSSEEAEEMSLLKSPLGVSGVGGRGMRAVRKAIRSEELPFVAHTAGGSGSERPAMTAAAPKPGGNFAASLSYGDVSLTGVGTTSYVCGDKVVAFGHPFFGYPQGRVEVGANDAESLGVIKDFFGPYKLATPNATYGLIDQDRFAGVRGLLGQDFDVIPVTSTVTADSTTRSGQTDVVSSDATPFLTFIHLLTNIDFTADRIGEGSAGLSWTINGTRADGTPWSLTRDNLFSSEWDISYTAISEIEQQLYFLATNDFEDVEFTSIDADVTVDEEDRRYSLTDTLVSKDGVNYQSVRRVRVKPGATVYLRMLLEASGGGADQVVDATVLVPKRQRRDLFAEIRGGSGSMYDEETYCMVEIDECGGSYPKITSFEELLAHFENKQKNNEMVVRLRGMSGRIKSASMQAFDRVVDGYSSVFIRVASRSGSGSSGGGSTPPKEG